MCPLNLVQSFTLDRRRLKTIIQESKTWWQVFIYFFPFSDLSKDQKFEVTVVKILANSQENTHGYVNFQSAWRAPWNYPKFSKHLFHIVQLMCRL